MAENSGERLLRTRSFRLWFFALDIPVVSVGAWFGPEGEMRTPPGFSRKNPLRKSTNPTSVK